MDKRCVLFLITGLTFVDLSRCCTDEVHACEDAFAARAGTTRHLFEHGIITNMTAERLTDMCSALKELTDCMDSHLSACDISFRLHMNGLIKMYTYICNEDFKDHVDYADCIGRNETVPGTDACFSELEVKLSDLRLTNSQACSIINDALDCIEKVAKGVCTEAAAKHRRDIELLFLQPVAELFLCPFGKSDVITTTTTGKMEISTTRTSSGRTGELREKDSGEDGLSKSEAVGLTFCLTALGAIVIAAIVVFVLRRRKKEQVAGGQSISFTNPGGLGVRPAQPEVAVDIAEKSMNPVHSGYTNHSFGNGLGTTDLPVSEKLNTTLA